jgi:predicted nucleic acid-binding protein
MIILDSCIIIDAILRQKEFPLAKNLIIQDFYIPEEVLFEAGNVLSKTLDSKIASQVLKYLKYENLFCNLIEKTNQDFDTTLELMQKFENKTGFVDVLLINLAKTRNLTLLTRDQEILKLANKYPVKNPYLENM